MEVEKVILKTKDGVEIVGDYYSVEGESAPAVVLLHMMPSDRKSWVGFAEKLQEKGIQSLAIDLRGHGESVNKNGEVLNYRKFSDREHQESIMDVEVAVDYFVQKGIMPENINIAGASIGANLALRFQSEHPKIKKSVLLSPGLDYKGIETEAMAEKLLESQGVFIAASEEDEYSTESSKRLYEITKAEKELKILQNAGHGTMMLLRNSKFEDEIIEWIKDQANN